MRHSTPHSVHRLAALAFCVLLAALLTACAAIGPRVIHEAPSMFGTLVVTDDGDNLRSMRFGRLGVTQSTLRVGDPDHLHHGYPKLALAGIALLPPRTAGAVPAPRRVLIIGLGGGTLPVFLHRHYSDVLIDVVDIDPAVIAAAKQFFGFTEDARMKAHAGDGRAFIEGAPKAHYDLIILDAFGGSEVPSHLTTREFLLAVRAALTPDGVVVSNVWSRNYNRIYERMLRTYTDVFATVQVLESAREVNHLVFALPQTRLVSREQFAQLAGRVGQERRFRFDLGQLVRQSFGASLTTRADAGPGQVPVLRDGQP